MHVLLTVWAPARVCMLQKVHVPLHFSLCTTQRPPLRHVPSRTHPLCGCVCDNGFSSSGSYYCDPQNMSANCLIKEDAAFVLKDAVQFTSVLCFFYAFKNIVTLKVESKKTKGLALHVRSLAFDLNVFIFMEDSPSRTRTGQTSLLTSTHCFLFFA